MEGREESSSQAVETRGWRGVGGSHHGHWESLGLSSPGFCPQPGNTALSVRGGPWALERECGRLSGTAASGRQAGFQGLPREGLLAWF